MLELVLRRRVAGESSPYSIQDSCEAVSSELLYHVDAPIYDDIHPKGTLGRRLWVIDDPDPSLL